MWKRREERVDVLTGALCGLYQVEKGMHEHGEQDFPEFGLISRPKRKDEPIGRRGQPT